MSLSLGSIAEALGGELFGDASVPIHGLAPLESAQPDQISFLSHPKYVAQLAGSAAACVIVTPALRDAASARGACILTADPYWSFACLTQLWRRRFGRVLKPGIHPSAVVDPEAQVHPSAVVGALCVVGAGARVGAGSMLHPRVTVGDDCSVGERCIIHSGAVIGADGFGFAAHEGRWEKIEQLGAVRIGNDVEIGANSCVDRGALADTVLEDGVKLDNLVQIGHNVRVGAHTAMAGCVGVAGSAVIGAHCTLGGGAIVLGHLRVADHVHISAASVVTRSILQPGQYTGFFPIDDNRKWERNAATLRQLHELRQRIKQIERGLGS